jgi:hypothetical protein
MLSSPMASHGASQDIGMVHRRFAKVSITFIANAWQRGLYAPALFTNKAR